MPDTNDYKLLDSGGFRKIEQLGPYRVIRPSAAAVWHPRHGRALWDSADAEFVRHSHGEGRWKLQNNRLPASWTLTSDEGLRLIIRLTDFGHVGIFPEHHCGDAFRRPIQQARNSGKPFKLLNLFAYTGAVSLLAASWGAEVVHVDASKTSVQWARENASANYGNDLKIRWITEDVRKFVARELRRASVYQGIVLDPPSFGRGARSEIWKIEEDLPRLLGSLRGLCSKQLAFVKLSAHSPGFTPVALENILRQNFNIPGTRFDHFEMLTAGASGAYPLPSGACCLLSQETL